MDTTTDISDGILKEKYWDQISQGIEYLQVSETRFDRITPDEPYKCTDPPLTENSDRQNCHFRDLTELWTYNQQE